MANKMVLSLRLRLSLILILGLTRMLKYYYHPQRIECTVTAERRRRMR
jgi:hypothetical protein